MSSNPAVPKKFINLDICCVFLSREDVIIGQWVNIIICRSVDIHVVNCRERRKYLILGQYNPDRVHIICPTTPTPNHPVVHFLNWFKHCLVCL